MGKCFTQRSLGMDPVVLNPYVMTKISQSISSYHVEMVLSFLPFLLSAHILGFLVAFSRPAHTIMDGPHTVDFGFQSCHTHRNFVLSQNSVVSDYTFNRLNMESMTKLTEYDKS